MLAILALVLLTAALAAPAAAHGPDDRWESRPAAPLPRQEAALGVLGGKLYLGGGFEEGGLESARHEVYDIATRTWTELPPLPEPMHHVSAAGVAGRVFYVGGLQTLAFVPTGRVWAYDPATGLHTLRASLPAGRARGAGALAVHDGKLLYVGGQRVVDGQPRREPVALVDMYDPQTDRWTALPDMPTPRDHFGVGIVGDTLYAVGGRKLRFDLPVTATEALDLRTMTWRTGLAPIPTPRGGFATAVVDREVITIGGESPAVAPPTPLDVRVHDDVEAYSPAGDRWRNMERMPVARYGIQGQVHEGGIYIAAGGIGTSVRTTAALDVLFPAPGLGPGS